MIRYKGWELIKMANEGKIKNGDEFKEVNGDLYIKFVNSADRFSFRNNRDVEIGNSYFTRDHIFVKKQKPLNFFEAMKAVDEGKKVTNDYLEDECGNYTSYYLKENNKLYYYFQGDNTGDVCDINRDEIICRWYIYED